MHYRSMKYLVATLAIFVGITACDTSSTNLLEPPDAARECIDPYTPCDPDNGDPGGSGSLGEWTSNASFPYLGGQWFVKASFTGDATGATFTVTPGEGCEGSQQGSQFSCPFEPCPDNSPVSGTSTWKFTLHPSGDELTGRKDFRCTNPT